MKTLFYLPLEPYIERSSYFMSAPNGWFEQHAAAMGYSTSAGNFVRVDASDECKSSHSGTIKSGVVLDAPHRAAWAASQVSSLCLMVAKGEVKDGDMVFFEDFWHPGMEGFFYACRIAGIKPVTGAFCFAQTLDEFDFITPLKDFVAPVEDGFAAGLDYIFFASEVIRGRALARHWGVDKCHAVGLPFNSTLLKEQLSNTTQAITEVPWGCEKNGRVIFTSRFDESKNPHFFLDVVAAMPDISFDLTCPRGVPTLDPILMGRISSLNNLHLLDTSRSKADYYSALAHASVQFNCARQDWVAWTLIEACMAGCVPVYPRHRDFPFELADFPSPCLYKNQDLESACQAIHLALLVSTESITRVANDLVARHNASIPAMIRLLEQQ
jgi:hypothetical protein